MTVNLFICLLPKWLRLNWHNLRLWETKVPSRFITQQPFLPILNWQVEVANNQVSAPLIGGVILSLSLSLAQGRTADSWSVKWAGEEALQTGRHRGLSECFSSNLKEKNPHLIIQRQMRGMQIWNTVCLRFCLQKLSQINTCFRRNLFVFKSKSYTRLGRAERVFHNKKKNPDWVFNIANVHHKTTWPRGQ